MQKNASPSQFDLEDIRREKAVRCRASLRYFFKQAWPIMEPGVPLVWNWHMDAIFEHLEAVMRGDITRLVVNLAPGHAKSTIFSVALPAWCWTFEPTARWLCASYSLELAMRDNNNCRAVVESEWYQSLFGDTVQMKPDQNTKGFFENIQRGYRLCTSVGSKGTGKRGSHLLIDDSNDSKATPTDIEATISWHGRTWMSRLNDMQFGRMIAVGQRINERDLSGYLKELGGWEFLVLPTEYEPARKCFTSIGWSDPREKEGELLWPEKFPPQVLGTLKKGLGSIAYAAQFQQSPVPSSGGFFKRHWLRYFAETPTHYILRNADATVKKRVLKSNCIKFVTCDLAISEKQESDYTVFSVWLVTPDKDLLLLDVIRGHYDNPEQQDILWQIWQSHRPAYFKVETVAYQLALVQQMRKKGVPIRRYEPVGKGDKQMRAITVAVMYEAEQVFHKESAEYLTDYEPELLVFPKGKNDDQVDTASMAGEEVGGVIIGGGILTDFDDDEADEEEEEDADASVTSDSDETPWW